MMVTVNGQPYDCSPGLTLSEILRQIDWPSDQAGVAIAHNGVVVARRAWPQVALDDGDRVEIVGAIQGG